MGDKSLERLREIGGRYWQPTVSLIAVFITLLSSLGDFLKEQGIPLPLIGSQPVSRWTIVGVFILVFVIIRFPRVAANITRWIFGQPAAPSDLGRIFRGPRPYGAQDKMPGRKAELDDCWAIIEQQRFLILDGESGCGKTSFINAGLILKARDQCQIIVCRINEDPFGKVHAALRQQPYRSGERLDDNDLIRAAAALAGAPAQLPILCLDQFEELFVTVPAAERARFVAALTKLITDNVVRVILALRSDFLDLLLRLCREVDPHQAGLNVGNYYTLRAFTKEHAESVLHQLFGDLCKDNPVIRQQVEDFAQELVLDLLRPPRDARLFRADEKTVLPVELQTVGLMIESLGVNYFSVGGLKKLGGKAGLLQRYVEDAKTFVWRKTGVEGNRALLVLRELVSPAQTKWSRTAKVVADRQNMPVEQVQSIFDAFGEKYLVNRLPWEAAGGNPETSDTSPRYELMHEHLVGLLVDAPDPVLQKMRQAEERLVFWTNQAKTAFENLRNKNQRWNRLRSCLTQPIPLKETIRLWKYARDPSVRLALRQNLRGFFARLAVVALVLSTPYFAAKLSLAHHVVNAPLAQYDPGAGYRMHSLASNDNSDGLFVILSFSGGGTRGAALAYGALEELRNTRIQWEGAVRSLLDEVDVISSVSGGSYTAAYYGLFRDQIFQDFEQTFLYRNVQAELFNSLFWNLYKLASDDFSLADLEADFYDREIFRGKTFRDLPERRPYVLLNATDIEKSVTFTFNQDDFDKLCSDLYGTKIALAVAASSAWALRPVTLYNYAGTCDYREHPWIEMALRDSTVNPQRYERARTERSYMKERPKIELGDGGVADSLSLRLPLLALQSIDLSWSLLQKINLREVKKVVVIIVNGNSSMGSSGSDTLELLHQVLQERDKYQRLEPSLHQVEIYRIYIGFDQIKDETERAYFLSIVTSFGLPKEQVDGLRRKGAELLRQSPCLKALLESGSAPEQPGASRLCP